MGTAISKNGEPAGRQVLGLKRENQHQGQQQRSDHHRMKLWQERLFEPVLAVDRSSAERVSQPAVSGMTMNTTTEVISTFGGTTTLATPQRNITRARRPPA
jgi:hypothetical protein